MKKLSLLGALALLCAGALCAEEAKKDAKKPAGKPAPAAPSRQSGMVVVRDPDGALRAPTAQEHQALTGGTTSAVRTGASPAQVNLGPGKGTMVRLDGAETDVYSVVSKGPDGKLRFRHATGAKAADRLVQSAPPVVAAPAAVKKEAAQ